MKGKQNITIGEGKWNTQTLKKLSKTQSQSMSNLPWLLKMTSASKNIDLFMKIFVYEDIEIRHNTNA